MAEMKNTGKLPFGYEIPFECWQKIRQLYPGIMVNDLCEHTKCILSDTCPQFKEKRCEGKYCYVYNRKEHGPECTHPDMLANIDGF